MLISAHQCSSVLISAFQCFSVLISAHQCSSARTSPCARQCRAGSAAARTRTPSGRCRGGEAMAETHVRMSRSSNQAQSSAIKRNQAQSREIAPAEGEAMTGTHGIRSRRHTLCREAKRRPVRRAEITYLWGEGGAVVSTCMLLVPFDEPRSRTCGERGGAVVSTCMLLVPR